MAIKIALAGNPNCGKTTMFNDLTGSNQYVGNWPGVTVEKKEGKLRGAQDVIIQDLPGIYSLSPYTLEEVVARGYLVNERPDAILNIVDATNIERNLYLTTQLSELGIPMVVALNMIDVTRKNGDRIDMHKLGAALGCQVVETSALKGEGSVDAAMKAAELAQRDSHREPLHVFNGSVEHALAHIEDLITHRDGQEPEHHRHADGSKHAGSIVEPHLTRWIAIKLFERDEKVVAELSLPQGIRDAIEKTIQGCEREMDDDAESIITNQRYLQEIVSRDDVAKLGTIKEADLEAVMACEPDIIFIGGRLSKFYDALSEIAPVVYLSTDLELGLVESTRSNTATIASIFGMTVEIDALITCELQKLD